MNLDLRSHTTDSGTGEGDSVAAPPSRDGLRSERRPSATAGAIARPLPAADVAWTNYELMAFLSEHEDLESVAVLEAGVPTGLINRRSFVEAFVRPFAREVFGKRSCAEWMDRSPLLVEAATPVEQLVRGAISFGAKVLKDGFIATSAGRYAGIGSGFALMEAMSALEVERRRKLVESIDYASMIQRSHLRASDEQLASALSDYALVWEPRDVVGGDCYFFRRFPEGLFGAVIDCTGHGVPGAFMTLIALSFLEHAVGRERRDPGATLAGLNRYIKRVLGQRAVDGAAAPAWASDGGLDGACFWLPADGTALEVASAHLGIFVARAGKPVENLSGDRTSVGYLDTPDDHEWPTRRTTLEPGSVVAIATDGLFDQIGGLRRIALGRRRVADMLEFHRGAGARGVGERLRELVVGWQADEPRRDDLTLLVFSPPRA